MYIEMDFNSEEALYIQLRNQIIYGIATREYKEGDALPSVRQLAETIGINMHTVNKAYTVLKQEGFVKVDRRRGAVISVDSDKQRALETVRGKLQEAIAEALCRGLSRKDLHELVDRIFDEYEACVAEAAAGAGSGDEEPEDE